MRAEALARKLHACQKDKAGAPYIEHLERVVSNLLQRWPDATEDEISAAWLHDSLEDTETTAFDLIIWGISERAVQIIQRLSNPKTTTYLEWISGIAKEGDQSVIRVKLTDNEDNSDPVRVAEITEGASLLEERYRPARAILERALTQPFR